MERTEAVRPWTVYVLTVWTMSGALWTLLSSRSHLGVRMFWFLLSVFVAWALFSGITWVFTWSFMLASLCVGLLLTVVLVQTFLLEQPPLRPLLIPAATSAGLIALLMHPATKRFARVEEPVSQPR